MTSDTHATRTTGENASQLVKCVVWDLDNTLWEGVLPEGDDVALRAGAAEAVRTLDERGILQSVASRNEERTAMRKLADLGLVDYFLYPQIHWNSKADSIRSIAKGLNIGLDAVAFVDDDPFERGEVGHTLPEVRCYDAAQLAGLVERPEMKPPFVTEDSRARRAMVQSDVARKDAEEEFVGPKEEFLATLNMALTLSPAGEEDLRRAEELTVRTNQLNTTGDTYSLAQLDGFRRSAGHLLLMATLTDRFGSYGRIGLALVEQQERVWTVKLLLMSCRVMSRGVGTILLNHVMALARKAGARLRAEFVPNDRNRMMHVTYRFAGFKEVEQSGERVILESELDRIQPCPAYVDLKTPVEERRNARGE